MPVDGAEYLILLVVAASAVFTLPRAWRPWILFCASVAFYALSGAPLALLFVPMLAAYAGGIALERPSGKRGVVLSVSLAAVFAPLFFYKVENSLSSGAFLMPLGLSFFTLQLAGYVLDVALGRAKAERRGPVFGAFGSFFPSLTAGPIERAGHLLPQLASIPDYDGERVRDGIYLLLIGLIKKTVFANPLAPAVAAVFSEPGKFSGSEILFGTFLARYQLYFDFSGYTDIALGSASILGITLAPNFNRPFAARSVADFWRRWHISLSSWMRDYVFFPLIAGGGARLGLSLCLIATFVTLGLWHGFTFNFALYGLVQGLLLAGHRITGPWRARAAEKTGLARHPRWLAAWQIGFTLIITASLPMILFKTKDLASAGAVASQMVTGGRSWLDFSAMAALAVPWLRLAVLIAVFELISFGNSRKPVFDRVARSVRPIQWLVGLVLLAVLIALGSFEKPVDFAYRNF